MNQITPTPAPCPPPTSKQIHLHTPTNIHNIIPYDYIVFLYHVTKWTSNAAHLIVPVKRMGSCGMMERRLRKVLRGKLAISSPSMTMRPDNINRG